ncbi:hypothetical protein GCM10027347_46760 [Larkinella harenae]
MRTITKVIVLLICGFTFSTQVYAQSADDASDKLSFSVALNHDAFFGLNPMASGSYQFTPKTALTFYGIQWGAGTGAAWANWTEFGLGVNFKAGSFNINPQLGFTMGSLLSSGGANRGFVGDGIVPNLTINHSSERFEGQLYFGYYGALRNEATSGNSTNNYVHYWLNAGVKATSWFSVGAHYESLFLAGGKMASGGSVDRADGYTWLGPYLQFSKGNAGFRFSFGGNLDEGFAPNDFYKMGIFYSF